MSQHKYKYKLTDSNMQTFHGFQWVLNVPVPPLNGDSRLCSKNWYHFYDSPLIAVLHNPIHANIKNPLLFKARVSGKYLNDNGLKCGYTEATLIKQLSLPVVTTTQRVAYGILCSLQVYKHPEYVNWAHNWLSGKDRTAEAAAWALVWATQEEAWAAWAAVRAAQEAVWAVVEATVEAAEAAVWAAKAAEAAAQAAKADLNLLKIAKQAMKIGRETK
jgi:hypothetical protein